MRRFLVVGCGGSGGATVAYLMDQLRADLASYGQRTLPLGWQFVHVDVPLVCEPGPDGLGSVEAQGGIYVGCGSPTRSYADLDDLLGRRLGEHDGFDTIASWAPRAPKQVTYPISLGAGQFRAVGRMIGLSQASRIRHALQSRWDRLSSDEARSEGQSIMAASLGGYDDGPPITLVVSSMAGGTGSALGLDVCRLLTLVPGSDPNLTCLFLLAPGIFDRLPAESRRGMWPNALAMIGDIVASQTGAAWAHDNAVMQVLGQPGPAGAEEPNGPFARVFPIGRSTGSGSARFGSGSRNAVLRGVGRGLAGLIMSREGTNQFVLSGQGRQWPVDTDRDLLGWGARTENLLWSTFGFASLGMGRDRYAEYSAQRIARSSLDHLLRGHLSPGDPASSLAQVKVLLDSRWEDTCHRSGLPAAESEIAGWLSAYAIPAPDVEGHARQSIGEELLPYVPDGTGIPVKQWVPALRHRLSSRASDLHAAAQRITQQLVFAWHGRLLEAVEVEVAASVASHGLPYAIAVVERIRRHAEEVVAPGLAKISARSLPELGEMPGEVDAVLERLRGTVANATQITDFLAERTGEKIREHVQTHAADKIVGVMLQFGPDVLGPLASALIESLRTLEDALGAEAVDLGLARLATDHVSAWPSDADLNVPDRFEEADNEVLLTPSADFHTQYLSDLRKAVEGAETFSDASTEVAKNVVSGIWGTMGGSYPPGGLLERRVEWRPRAIPVDVRTGRPVIPSPAKYDAHVRPAELLSRARSFVWRFGQSFHQFCRVSLADFAADASVGESEIARRRRMLVSAFDRATALARPSAGINPTALDAVHDGLGLGYRYTFSDVPFRQFPEISGDLEQVLSVDPLVDQLSLDNLTAALSGNTNIDRIDIFGSCPDYSPLVFEAVLRQAAEQWGRSRESGREQYWRWRRARPLDAALPMGEDERRAMVAGWLLGRIVGRIRVPRTSDHGPVQIWDSRAEVWIPFPHPLLTPPQRFETPHDWLPAVLESVLLAIARSHETPVMSSLRPYRILRCIYDSSSQSASRGIAVADMSARRIIAEWLSGRSVAGGVSAVPGIVSTSSSGQRVDLAARWLNDMRELAGVHYMAPGQAVGPMSAPGGGMFSVLSAREQASRTPMFRDIAPDVFWATGELAVLLREAEHGDRDSARSVIDGTEDSSAADAGETGNPANLADAEVWTRPKTEPELVFICHSSDDKERVRQLYQRLTGDGIICWLDEEDILPGQDWDYEIRKAIDRSRYIITCLSNTSITKTGYLQKELRRALDLADERPDGATFIIPLKLEPCDVPDRLSQWQWVSLYRQGEYERLSRVLRSHKNP